MALMMDPPYDGPKMEARDPEGTYSRAPREIEDPFRYGSRWVYVKTGKGKEELREVPLTLEDLFDPQEGDYVPHSTVHGDLVSASKEMIRQAFRRRGRTDVLVCDDVKMLWKDPSLAQIAPDVAVIPGIADPERYRPVFDEAKEGTGPVFVLEVVSKATRSFDSGDKPTIYRRARVEECFILDPLKSPWELVGRRLAPRTGRYRKIRPDREGRVRSQTLGLDFAIAPEGDRLILVDVATGEPLRTLGESESAREAAESAREAAEAKNRELAQEIERLRAELRDR